MIYPDLFPIYYFDVIGLLMLLNFFLTYCRTGKSCFLERCFLRISFLPPILFNECLETNIG